MTPSEREGLLKVVSAWLDSANQVDSSDVQLILTREGVKASKVNHEPIGVGISIKAMTHVAIVDLSLNKIVTPASGLVLASLVAPADAAKPNPEAAAPTITP